MAKPPASLSDALEQRLKMHESSTSTATMPDQSSASTPIDTQTTPTAPLPPSKRQTVDQVLADMKKIPLFMTSLDDLDEDNEQLQALRALAYEGTRAEQAANFRQQGNECVQTKLWKDAREFYTQALAALKRPRGEQSTAPVEGDGLEAKIDAGGLPGSDDRIVEVEIDEVEEDRKERAIEEACYANRALCNLEMKNYGSTQRDCAAALRLNARNVKAWYRASLACLAVEKLPEALDACDNGLACDASNTALQNVRVRIVKRQNELAERDRVRTEREQRKARQQATLARALTSRRIASHTDKSAPTMEDASVVLADADDETSALSVPVLLLYPVHAQSDYVKAFGEEETLRQHLEYILPLPWDEEGGYILADVECYMGTATGGLIKAGKNLTLAKLLAGGKVEVVNGLVSVYVVPKTKAAQWIEEFKQRRGKS